MIQISFNYDENTNTVNNIVVRNLTSKKESRFPTVEVKENKLVISPKAIGMIGCITGDRITIQYFQESPTVTFPIIGLSFKGFQRKVLIQYGTEFVLEPFQEGMFKMVPSSSVTYDIQRVF